MQDNVKETFRSIARLLLNADISRSPETDTELQKTAETGQPPYWSSLHFATPLTSGTDISLRVELVQGKQRVKADNGDKYRIGGKLKITINWPSCGEQNASFAFLLGTLVCKVAKLAEEIQTQFSQDIMCLEETAAEIAERERNTKLLRMQNNLSTSLPPLVKGGYAEGF